MQGSPLKSTQTRREFLRYSGRLVSLAGGLGFASQAMDCSLIHQVSAEQPQEQWVQRAGMLTPKLLHASAAVDGRLFVFGGVTVPPNALAFTEEYDVNQDRWVRRSDMITPRFAMTTAVVKGKVFAIGGATNGWSPSQVLEEYDPATDTWLLRSPMPTARLFPMAAVVDDRILVIGGEKPADVPNYAVEVYSTEEERWEELDSMPERFHVSATDAVTVNGKVYIVGGFSLPNFAPRGRMLVFDPESLTWKQGAEIPTPRFSLSVVSVGETVLAIGGVDMGLNALSIVEAYSPASDSWAERNPMLTRRGYFSVSALRGRVLLASGGVRRWGEAPLASSEALSLEGAHSLSSRGRFPTLWGGAK